MTVGTTLNDPVYVSVICALMSMKTYAYAFYASYAMIEPLPDDQLMLDVDPSSMKDEIQGIIQEMLNSNERSQQVDIGASEIGTPCNRKLIYKLGVVDKSNNQNGTWQQGVGTILHNGFHEMLSNANPDRWITEQKVYIGDFAGQQLTGHLDVYDRWTGNIIDWKFLGATSLKKMKTNNHPGQTYRTQLQCYGAGVAKIGIPVTNVHVMALPQSGNLKDMFHWYEPYDPAVAEHALQKAERLALAGRLTSFGKLAVLATTYDDYCDNCPWFSPSEDDPMTGKCPGSAEIQAERLHNMSKPPPKLAFGYTDIRRGAK